jgi:hypothetical protein
MRLAPTPSNNALGVKESFAHILELDCASVIRVVPPWTGATVDIKDGQRDVRTVFFGGFAGQLVSSGIWFLSAALATWGTPKAAIAFLVLGGMFIFPLTQLAIDGSSQFFA